MEERPPLPHLSSSCVDQDHDNKESSPPRAFLLHHSTPSELVAISALEWVQQHTHGSVEERAVSALLRHVACHGISHASLQFSCPSNAILAYALQNAPLTGEYEKDMAADTMLCHLSKTYDFEPCFRLSEEEDEGELHEGIHGIRET